MAFRPGSGAGMYSLSIAGFSLSLSPGTFTGAQLISIHECRSAGLIVEALQSLVFSRSSSVSLQSRRRQEEDVLLAAALEIVAFRRVTMSTC